MTAVRNSDRWRDVWERQISDEEVGLLREVMKEVVKSELGRDTICSLAGIQPHDLKNFLADHRPRYLSGLRMLHYVVNWKASNASAGLKKKLKRLEEIARRISIFDPDEDFLYRHLERLGIVKEDDCRRICTQLAGNYDFYRLSRRPEIGRAHV